MQFSGDCNRNRVIPEFVREFMWFRLIDAKSRSTIHRESIPQAGRSKNENLKEIKPNPPLEGGEK